jgi:hypothetical protein
MSASGSAVEFKLFETAKKGLVNGHSPLSASEVQSLRELIQTVQSSPAFNINHQVFFIIFFIYFLYVNI